MVVHAGRGGSVLPPDNGAAKHRAELLWNWKAIESGRPTVSDYTIGLRKNESMYWSLKSASRKESKAMHEVRAWKAACARDVAGMEIGAAVRKRLKDSAAAAERLGFRIPSPAPRQIPVVTERKAKYTPKRKK